MKIKNIILAAALSAGLTGLAGAQTNYVYMTGSTAIRSTVYAALNDGTGTNVFDSPGPTYVGYNGSSASGANFMLFAGKIGGTNVTVKCSWSGSEAGIGDVSTTNGEAFLSDSVIAGGSQLASTPSGSQLITNGVDLAMADNAFAFSKSPSTTATQVKIAVIPFKFIRGTNSMAAAANITNITDAEFRQNAAGGVPLALYTGNPADTTNFCYISGRNDNSGTRANTFGITGFGIKSACVQIEMNTNGAMVIPPPGDGGDGVDYTTEEGFNSGGTLAGTLGGDSGVQVDQIASGNPTGFVCIAYLGISDASTALGKGAKELSYDGYFESDSTVEEGKYAFWGNEYIDIRHSPDTQASTVDTKLKTSIPVFATGTTAIALPLMHAQRGGPTTDPAHN